MKCKKFPENKLPLGGWVSPPSQYYGIGKDFISDEVFVDVKKSGVNILHTNIDRVEHFSELDRFVKCAEREGVYLIIGDDSFINGEPDEQESIAFIEYCKRSPVIIGINFSDEPNASKFEKLKRICQKYRPYMGDLLLYVNLLPMYAYAPHLKGLPGEGILKFPTEKEYAEYVNDFLDHVDVDILSFDYYPFTHEKGVIKGSYFKNLSIAKRIAKERNLPLWNFMQVTSWKYDMIRNMTYSEILWQVNTSLCCGVEGLNYFCYWTPFDCNGEYFNSAMVSRYGLLTDHYYFVREINHYLEILFSYLSEYTYKGLIAFGETGAEVPERDNLYEFGEIKHIYADGCLIGCFQKEDKSAYYVVNASFLETRHIHIKMKKECTFTVLKGSEERSVTTEELHLVLSEGEGVFVMEK